MPDDQITENQLHAARSGLMFSHHQPLNSHSCGAIKTAVRYVNIYTRVRLEFFKHSATMFCCLAFVWNLCKEGLIWRQKLQKVSTGSMLCCCWLFWQKDIPPIYNGKKCLMNTGQNGMFVTCSSTWITLHAYTVTTPKMERHRNL